MSWWDTSGFSSFATQALKNAQKKIDKVLDIKDDEQNTGEHAEDHQSKRKDDTAEVSSSWSSWGSFSMDKSDKDDDGATSAGRSAWSMPWAMDTSMTKENKPKSSSSLSLKTSKSKPKQAESLKKLPDKSENSAAEFLDAEIPKVSSSNVIVTSSEENKTSVKEAEKPSEDNRLKDTDGKDCDQREELLTEHSALESSNILVSESLPAEHKDDIPIQDMSKQKDPDKTDEDSKQIMKNLESIGDNQMQVSTEDNIPESEVFDQTKIESEDMHQVNKDAGSLELLKTDNKESDSCDKSYETSKTADQISEETSKTADQISDETSKTADQISEETVSLTFINDNNLETGGNQGVDAVPEVDCVTDMSDETPKTKLQHDQEAVTETEEDHPSKNILEVTGNGMHECCDISVDDSKEVKASSPPIDIPQKSDAEIEMESYKISDLPLSPSTASSLGGTDSDTNKLDSSLDNYTSDETVVDKEIKEKNSEEMSKSDESRKESENLDFKEGSDSDSGKIGDTSMSEISPSSSYVKCMIEEAMDMEDNSKLEDNGSDTPSIGGENGSRSTGGHDSGDEISTTTSSDIEIISTPSTNGEGNKMVDLSPLKIALQKTSHRGSPTHRRSDSQSSSSTHSREGQFEQLSPGRDTDDGHYHDDHRLSSEGARHELFPLNESYETEQQQKLTKLQAVPEIYEPTNNDVNQQKFAEMAEILQARETKLVQLSKENNDLMETNSILRNQLQQSEEAREAEMADINKVTTEFTERLSESEKKIKQVIREKENMKKQLQEAQDELTKKIKDRSLQNLIEEKDQQIAELLQEGEKLSKQQLQSNNIIKKLRAKEKENESILTSQKKKLEEQKTELEHLHKVCEVKDDLEKKQTDAINQLNAAVQKQDRETSRLKSDLEDSQERVRGLQTALDKSYKEIADLHRSNAAQDSKAAETALSLEMQVREELKSQLEQERKSKAQEKEALIMQIEDLRMTVSRMEKEHNRREDMLRQEISDLQRHLQEDEARNQELTQNVTSATRPLLRQIENLQSTYAAQSLSWEKVEKNLSDRLVENQTQLAAVVEKERFANEKVMELSTQVATLESQNSRLRQDKAQQTAQLEILKTKVQVLEDAKHSEAVQIEAVKQQMTQELSDLKKEKIFLETQLDMEKNKVDQEKKKVMLAHEQISQLEKDLQRPQSRGSISPLSVSRTESISGEQGPMFTSFTQDDLDRSLILSPGTNKTSLYESVRQSGGVTNLLDNLQSQLKQRDGEILQLRSDIQQLERTRESMARELVNLTNQNQEIQEQIEQLPHLQTQLEDVNQRYNALLQMYGEKVEEADELRLDLQDVKEMYKLQIDHLLAK